MPCCQELPFAIYWSDFPTLITPLPFDALNERDHLELSGTHLVLGKLEWLGYNLVNVA